MQYGRYMKKGVKLIIEKNPDTYDHDNVRFLIDGQTKGFGYRGKKSKKIGLITCPVCEKENYVMNVTAGICTWCGFSANK